MFLESLSWQSLIVSSCLFTTVSMILNKYQSHRGSSVQVLTSKYTGSITAAVSWWLLTSRQIPSNWWAFYIYGAGVAASLVIYTKAQRINMSQTSMVQPIGHILGVALVAVILSEWSLFGNLGAWKLWLALGLMPMFFWSFYEPEDHYSKKWIKLISVYLVIIAIYKVVIKLMLNSAGAAEILVFQYLGSLSGSSLGTIIKRQPLLPSKKFALKGWLQGLVGGSGIFLYYSGVAKTSMTQATLVRTPLLTLLSVVAGLVLFKEVKKMSKKKWLGSIVAGVITWLVSTH